jgi:hypothetical protein
MIVTEEEAKTKRCQEAFPAAYGLSEGGIQSGPIATHSVPGVSMSSIGGAAYAVYSEPHGGAPMHCLGSACMAWRWSHGSDDMGYCGKAGKP